MDDKSVLWHPVGVTPTGLTRTPKQRLRAEITSAKALAAATVGNYKVGKVYHVTMKENTVILINEIGPHPLSRVPTAYGFIIDVNGPQHGYLPLYELAGEFVN